MPLAGPNHEDIRKIHAESNQIVNQRFVLTTLALTLFGVLIAWMIPRSSSGSDSDADIFPFAVAVVLSLLLFGLYLWSHLLKNVSRIFAWYLIETKSSGWEVDWIEYRRERYAAYTKPQTVIFLLLNALGVAFAFFLHFIAPHQAESGPWQLATFGIGLTIELLMYFMGFHGLFYDENKISKRWAALNAK